MEDLGGLPVVMTDFDPIPGATYTIKWDGVEYVRVSDAEGTVGNKGIAGEEDTGEPFMFTTGGVIATTEGEHTFSVTEHRTTLHPVLSKWLPQVPTETKIIYYNVNTFGSATFDDDNEYDFYHFAEMGILDFLATVQNKEGDELGQGSHLRFCATSVTDGKVAEYASTFYMINNNSGVQKRCVLFLRPLSRKYALITY